MTKGFTYAPRNKRLSKAQVGRADASEDSVRDDSTGLLDGGGDARLGVDAQGVAGHLLVDLS
jgi:hypothetical protein